MGRNLYVVGRTLARLIYAGTIRGRVIRPEIPERPGGYVLAATHISHLEPGILTAIVRRKIDWMARIEFYKYRIGAWCLYAMDTFPVNRFGVPVSAIRAAIERARAGRVIGIFPEGGVAKGPAAACRGGPIKRGACLVAMRADVPIVPCVILGTHVLEGFYPWLPFRRATLWIAFGEPIEPPRDAPTHKAGRAVMARQLSEAFCALYRELCERYNLPEETRNT
jgi:1-acyl-sn-glycerol-3-phosphate acyltransferase